MKKITFLFCFLISFSGYSTNWLRSMEEAQKLALASNRLIVLDFTADWCGPCKKMEREVWYDSEVMTAINNFVPLQLNYDELVARHKFNVKAIPDIYILNGNGDVVYHRVGYMDKKRTLDLLKKYSLQTSFFQAESINYFKHPSYVTSLRLAKKYLDYSLGLDEDDVKRNFLELAENYLGETQNQMDENQANFKMIGEQIQLLDLVSDMYKERYRRVFRILGKDFEESSISEINKPLYYFLYAGCSKFDDHKDKAKWLEKLNSADRNAIFLKKLELMTDSSEVKS